MIESDWHDLTCSATASEVTTLLRYRNECIIIIIIIAGDMTCWWVNNVLIGCRQRRQAVGRDKRRRSRETTSVSVTGICPVLV